MKLLDHVLKIRQLIAQAISNRFERLGLTDKAETAEPSLNEDDRALRARLKEVMDYHAKGAASYAEARRLTVNECTFTLFNRLSAIKVMEDKEFYPEIIMRRAEYGGRSFEHNAWLENHPEQRAAKREGLLAFFESKFEELAEQYPIFRAEHPYAVMPMADEFNEVIQAFNEVSLDPDCGADIWRGDDILGWLYENFNVVEKQDFKESGDKTEYDKVSLQSQVYTPQWVVKFLVDNSVGKMYLEMFPDSPLCSLENEDGSPKYLIANRPSRQVRRVKPLDQWRIIDPACGSGNFLIYAFTLLYDLYVDQIEHYGAEFSKREIPSLIIENNLYGIDLDERAAQLSNIALRIKAREVGGRRARTPKKTHVVCSNFILPRYEQIEEEFRNADWDGRKQEVVKKIWIDLRQAGKFGSLVRIEEPIAELEQEENEGFRFSMGNLFADQERDSLFNFKRTAVNTINNIFHKYVTTDSYTSTKVEDALAYLDMLSNPFDVAVANPPYTDSSDFGPELKEFIEENYKKPYKCNSNLYAAFIRRCWELTHETGKLAMIHPMTFMYIKSFEDVRKFILDKTHINLFVEYGLSNLFGSIMVDPAFYCLEKNESEDDTTFISLDQYTRTPEEKLKKQYCLSDLKDLCNQTPNNRVYHLNQEKLRQIKSYPFIYWISDDFRDKFGGIILENIATVVSGFKTGNNEGALRHWWEVKQSSNDWQPYTKGGGYNKWYGNVWLLLNCKNDFEFLKKQRTYNIPSKLGIEGVTYSADSSKASSFRFLEAGINYDMKSSSIFSQNSYTLLSFLNSKLADYCLNCLNPTVTRQATDIKRLPFFDLKEYPAEVVVLDNLAKSNISIKKQLCEFSLIEPLFKRSPIGFTDDARCEIKNYFIYENAELTKVLLNEAIINEIIFKIYELTPNDRQMVLDKEGDSVGTLSVSRAAYEAWQAEYGDCDVEENGTSYQLRFAIDDNQPSLNFDTLYQKNYEWEEFCIQNQVNPIEAWYQFKNSDVLPAQRTQVLAFELITDVIRTLLEKDDDGVMPLVERTGEGTVADRIQQEMIERGYSNAQFTQIVNLLGMPLERYLRDRFFAQLSDHLNLFMYLPKTPFIWHLTSGPNHAMELFVSIYKWNRNTLSRVKSVYCANREAALRDRLLALAQKTDDTAAQVETADIRAQLRELNEFADKLDALLASDYNPKLDDGVGKNIAPLQKAGVLSYAVLKETGGKGSQLNKFLNADW